MLGDRRLFYLRRVRETPQNTLDGEGCAGPGCCSADNSSSSGIRCPASRSRAHPTGELTCPMRESMCICKGLRVIGGSAPDDGRGRGAGRGQEASGELGQHMYDGADDADGADGAGGAGRTDDEGSPPASVNSAWRAPSAESAFRQERAVDHSRDSTMGARDDWRRVVSLASCLLQPTAGHVGRDSGRQLVKRAGPARDRTATLAR